MFGYHQAAPHFQQYYPRSRVVQSSTSPSYPSYTATQRSPSPPSHHQHAANTPTAPLTWEDLFQTTSPTATSAPTYRMPASRTMTRTPYAPSHELSRSCGVQAFNPMLAANSSSMNTRQFQDDHSDNDDSDSQLPTLEQYEIFDAMRRRKEKQELEERQARRRVEEERFLAAQIEAQAEARARTYAQAQAQARAQAKARAEAEARARARARAQAEAEAAEAEAEARRAAYTAYLQRQRAEARERIQAQAERAAAAAAASSSNQQEQRKKAFFTRVMEQIQRQVEAEAEAEAAKQAQAKAQAEAKAKEESAQNAFKREQEAAQKLVDEWKKEAQQPANPAAEEHKKQATQSENSNTLPSFSPEELAKVFLAQLGLLPVFAQTDNKSTTGDEQADVKGKGKANAATSSSSTTTPSTPSPAAPSKAQSASPQPSKVRFEPSNDENAQMAISDAESEATVENSLKVLDRLNSRFEGLRKSFVEPESLVFEISESSTSSTDLPALAFAPINRPIKEYDEVLTRLLTQLDEVESHGSEQVKKNRKDLAVAIQNELDRLDAIKVKHWTAQETQFAKKPEAEEAPDTPTVSHGKESEQMASDEALNNVGAVTKDASDETNSSSAVAHGGEDQIDTDQVAEYNTTESAPASLDAQIDDPITSDEPSAGAETTGSTEAQADQFEQSPVADHPETATEQEMEVEEEAQENTTIASLLDIETETPIDEDKTAVEEDALAPLEPAPVSAEVTTEHVENVDTVSSPHAESSMTEEASVQTLSPAVMEEQPESTPNDEEPVLFEVESVSDGSSAGSQAVSEQEDEPADVSVSLMPENVKKPVPTNKATTVSDEEDDDESAEVHSETSFEWIE